MSAAPTLVIRRDSRAMRAYGWLWGADPREANFCKLFWAVIFAPLALFVLKPLRFLLCRRATGKGLGRIEGFAARHPQFGRIASIAYIVVWSGAVLFGLVVGFIQEPVVTASVVGGSVLLGLVVGWLLRAHLDAVERFGWFLLTGYRAVKTRTCPRIELREDER